MNIKEDIRVEKTLNITENDVVNGGEVLVLVAYAIKENEDLYSFLSPQIFSNEIYEKNKTEYDNAVKGFRAKCE